MSHSSFACRDCGAAFVFDDQERARFEERGLAPPKRCKPCRQARRSDPRGLRPSSAPPPRPAARLWDARCTGCGAPARVPFEPLPGRDVLCRECWDRRKRALDEPDSSDPGVVE